MGRKGAGFSTSTDVYSFLLFCLLNLFAFSILPGFFVVFLVLVEVDGLATLANSDLFVSIDRSTFFLALVILSVAQGSYDLFLLFAEIIIVVIALDFSFLLRRVGGTVVDSSVFRRRLDSYAYTAAPALLLAYLLTAAYSFLTGPSLPDPLELLAVSSTGALLSVYAVSRYVSSRVEGPRKK
ncbi:MAG: hypothetical protein JRN09_02840 [Nitrososphaerota archaeon]|nr:hypothetical protein [Nitrososphaerota archaeon]